MSARRSRSSGSSCCWSCRSYSSIVWFLSRVRGTHILRPVGGKGQHVKLLYKPFGIVLGLLAGFLSKKIFDQVGGLIDDYEPPKPTDKEVTWPKMIAAAAVEGIAFSVTRAAVDRA